MILKYRVHLIYCKRMITARARIHVWEPRVVTPIQLSLKSAMNLWNFYIFIRRRMRIDFWVADCQVYNGFPWTPHLKMWEKKKVTFQVSSNARLWPLGCTFLNDQITGERNVLLPWCNYSVLKAPSVTIMKKQNLTKQTHICKTNDVFFTRVWWHHLWKYKKKINRVRFYKRKYLQGFFTPFLTKYQILLKHFFFFFFSCSILILKEQKKRHKVNLYPFARKVKWKLISSCQESFLHHSEFMEIMKCYLLYWRELDCFFGSATAKTIKYSWQYFLQ